jgi:Protein of unknown function (DUF3341)
MTAIYGLFTSPEMAQRAVDGLRAAGIDDREITIQSSEPLEEYEFGSRDRETIMPWIAVFGGLAGLIAGYLLTSITQRSWAINTGGMPIVTNWSNLIVIFEMAMLGAVAASVFTLLISARIPNRLPKLYDPEIAMGKILIGVANPRDAEVVRRELRAGSAGIREQ